MWLGHVQFWNLGEAQWLEIDFVHEIGGILTLSQKELMRNFLNNYYYRPSMILRDTVVMEDLLLDQVPHHFLL